MGLQDPGTSEVFPPRGEITIAALVMYAALACMLLLDTGPGRSVWALVCRTARRMRGVG